MAEGNPVAARVGGVIIMLVVVAIPAALVGGGGWLLYQRAVGTQVQATVLACETSGNWRKYGSTIREDCAAEWTVDGERVVGSFVAGNGASDVGRTVTATVRGDTAYSRSLVLPIIMLVLGLPFLYLLLLGLWQRFHPPARESVAEPA